MNNTLTPFQNGEDTCGECGQKIRKLNPHRICKAKLAVLRVLADCHRAGHVWVRVEAGRKVKVGGDVFEVPYRAAEHAMRLVWFGLARHHGPRTGEYRITPEGREFLAGTLAVPRVIYCRDGRVRERSGDLVTVRDVRGVVLDKAYWDNYAEVQVMPGWWGAK